MFGTALSGSLLSARKRLHVTPRTRATDDDRAPRPAGCPLPHPRRERESARPGRGRSQLVRGGREPALVKTLASAGWPAPRSAQLRRLERLYKLQHEQPKAPLRAHPGGRIARAWRLLLSATWSRTRA